MTREANAKGPGRREGEITLSGLRTFVAVVEAQSFSGAADALGVSQPTVSVQLSALEQACGVLLVHRKPQLALTDAGRDLFVRARIALGRVGEFVASAHDLRAMQRGQLRLGLSTPHVALPIIASFVEKFPAIEITARIGNTAELLEDINRCRIDLGIMTLVEPPSALACTLVSTPRLVVCMRTHDPLASRPSLRPAELAGREFVLREQGSMTRAVLESVFASDSVKLASSFVIASREAMKEAVAAGMGLGAIFDNELGFDPRLISVPFATQPVQHGVFAVGLKESLDIPPVRAFIDHIPTAQAILSNQAIKA